MTTKAPAPDRNLRAPKLKLPPGATDCHFHIYGPQTRFPLAPSRGHQMEDSTLQDLLALQKALGLSRGVVTQSFQNGFMYEFMLHALTSEPERLRGVTSPAPDITDGEFDILAKAGVVGMRFARRSTPELDVRTLKRGHERGLHAQYFLTDGDDIAAWGDQILSLPSRFVLDNLGNPPIEKGIESDEFRFVRKCLDTGRCWVKLTARFSKQDNFPFDDILPFVHHVVARYPDRILWGSDWPHPGYFKPMPNDADLVDLVAAWAPDEAVRKKLFVDNPIELFGFAPVH
jgi:2-pyrone-4,6-dicarboxylate lactonase